ncbi:MAG: hypothetical protein IJ007_08615 [Oscillospiraceae bacterium]|nr:hypothetical protein [Oscillospiraceae bacterium]
MGKQINYFMEYEAFLTIAEKALKNGCIILKNSDGKFLRSRDISIVTKDCRNYYFYLPEAGELKIMNTDFGERIHIFDGMNAVIEAGYSLIHEERKRIIRSRLYVQSGYYDDNGEWIPRPQCLEKTYNKLVYSVKKLTTHLGGWEYATPYVLNLKKEQEYSLNMSL